MSGCVIVLVGAKETGKTYTSKELLHTRPDGMPIMIYDPNQEYEEFDAVNKLPMKEFKEEAITRKNTYIIFEEATIFFRQATIDDPTKEMLVNVRHTGNIIQYNFHAFRFIPPDLFSLADYVIVFKTIDNPRKIMTKFQDENLFTAYERVRASKDILARQTVEMRPSIRDSISD